MEVIVSLLQQMCVYLVVAYLFSKTPLLKSLFAVQMRLPPRAVIYVVFTGFCILGTYFGLELMDAIVNTRAIGAVVGGLLGGPLVGFLIGLTGGLHRYTLGGFTDLACALSTTAEGLLGGLVHLWLQRRGRLDTIFNPWVAFLATMAGEFMQMGLLVLVARPFAQTWALVEVIAAPMILANSFGALLFMSMIRDQRDMFEKVSQASSTKALRIAERAVGITLEGLTPATAERIAKIVYEETGVGAVAITDRERILAFVGIGADHHVPGSPVTSDHSKKAITSGEVVFADGIEVPYSCSLSDKCRLGSSLVVPIRSDTEVIGTIKLYEPKKKLFLNINRTLGEGIASLLSNQILAGRFQQQKHLLVQSELKLIQAQVNPHFLFNALNTISAIIRKNPDEARDLLLHLSNFFRKNLKRASDMATLREEIEHVESYLRIQKARFGDNLQVEIDIDPALLDMPLPTFTLQPIVENAIKHGVSNLLGEGRITIRAGSNGAGIALVVEDNAGAYGETDAAAGGLGIAIVDKRIKNLHGQAYGVSIESRKDEWTRVRIGLPALAREEKAA
ncbi:sensor histidine kinase [Xanthobacteraceae bacterium Astr-EGSB]|uniref:LytS/YhcK type 5TM receptor domain-containing protein n=1 Tax=Astrobacterium formosum TaxID=3069710 RepID=UPI0027B095D9|nr:sensor histidine kinase [Xanthobacteraceae bacterium Astr-EGSB]